MARRLMPTSAPAPVDPSLGEAELRQAIELLFFAYRDFTADADAVLAQYGFGRAHHRIIYFVGRHPGATVSHLLGILKITKQSLGRVLNQLLHEGFVVQKANPHDRRHRLLHLTDKGRELEAALTALQARRIARAYAEAGAGNAPEFRGVLRAIVNPEDRGRIDRLDLDPL
jgi:DNA-binding MarR family transcriptional regulator